MFAAEAAEAVAREAAALARELGERLVRAEPHRLAAVAEERRAQLVVVPGGGRLRPLLTELASPLVVVPPGARSGTGGSLVLGVGGTEHAAPEAAAELAALLGLRPIALHASGSDHGLDPDSLDAAARLLSASADRLGEEAEARYVHGPPAQQLEAVAARERSRLIVVGWRGRGPLCTLLSGSVSGWLARRASRPVVIVPPRARVEWGFTCMERTPGARHDGNSLPRGEAMRLFRRKPEEDLPDVRCPQCGERLPEENTVECLMCGADLRPLSARPVPEDAPR